jgi:nitrite reductase/ring-hydroxylating ferredoxin subunit
MTGSFRPVYEPFGESAEFEVVASISDIAEGTLLQRVRSSGDAVCLVRHNGVISAVSDICTHQHFSMSLGELLSDGTLQCAWHGARYDCHTGEVKQVPAVSPLPVFQVRLEAGQILVGPRCKRVDGQYEQSAVPVP